MRRARHWEKGLSTLSHPGAKETGQSHARLTALGATRTPTDFASNDQGTHTALGEIVVRGNSRDRDEDEQFWQKVLNALAKGLLGNVLLQKGLAEFPQPQLVSVLLHDASLVLRTWRQMRIGSQIGPGDGLIVDGFDVLRPETSRASSCGNFCLRSWTSRKNAPSTVDAILHGCCCPA